MPVAVCTLGTLPPNRPHPGAIGNFPVTIVDLLPATKIWVRLCSLALVTTHRSDWKGKERAFHENWQFWVISLIHINAVILHNWQCSLVQSAVKELANTKAECRYPIRHLFFFFITSTVKDAQNAKKVAYNNSKPYISSTVDWTWSR